MNPAAFKQALSTAVHEINKDQTLADVRTLDQIKTESMATNRLRSLLLTVFASIAVLLAAIGIYGVIAYSVEQRTHELGIRAALGASRGDLLRLVLRSGMLMAGLGLVLGFARRIRPDATVGESPVRCRRARPHDDRYGSGLTRLRSVAGVLHSGATGD